MTDIKFPLDSTVTEQTELGLKLLVPLVLFGIFFFFSWGEERIPCSMDEKRENSPVLLSP